MTKAEELKLLAQIDALIKSADAGDYIPMTFAGVVDVCRSNIENDFGIVPVQDMEKYLETHNETCRRLAEAQKMCIEAMDENERLRKLSAEWEQNAHDAGDLYCELEEECKQKDAEIIRLRAEIVRMRMERMTEAEIAGLYDKTEGVN